MSDLHDRRMMENLYWWGIPTFFRCPHQIITAEDAQNPADIAADIALIGVPHSTGNGSTERDQHLGPRAVRNVSAVQRRVHLDFQLDPWQAQTIIDAGDVPFARANDNEACIQQITDFYSIIDKAGVRPVSIGGDHSITGGILQALGKGHLSQNKPVSLLHLDAHTDVFTQIDHFLGAHKSAAHWGAYLADAGLVSPKDSVQIGLRGHPRTLDWLQPSYDYGYNVITMKEYRARKRKDIIAEIQRVLADRAVYITFDLDCLDPTIAPAVSNLEPSEGGFLIDEAIEILRAVRGFDVIGADIVCMMPTKDSPNQITALTATAIMFEMICLIAESKTR